MLLTLIGSRFNIEIETTKCMRSKSCIQQKLILRSINAAPATVFKRPCKRTHKSRSATVFEPFCRNNNIPETLKTGYSGISLVLWNRILEARLSLTVIWYSIALHGRTGTTVSALFSGIRNISTPDF